MRKTAFINVLIWRIVKIEHRFSPPFCERGFRHFYHSRSFLSRFLFKKKADPSFLIQSLLFLLLAQKKETKKKALAIEKTPKISAPALNKTNSFAFGELRHVLFLTGFRFDFKTAFFQRPENAITIMWSFHFTLLMTQWRKKTHCATASYARTISVKSMTGF